MPRAFHPAALAAATLLLVSLPSAQAQRTGLGSTLYDAYTGPVEALPEGCSFLSYSIDAIPRSRPVLQKPSQTAPAITRPWPSRYLVPE